MQIRPKPAVARRSWAALLTAACIVAACSEIRHPLDDSEARPDTETLAIDEAGDTMDAVGDDVLGAVAFTPDTWAPDDSCATAPFAPEQGDVGLVLIRAYDEQSVIGEGSVDGLLDEYEEYWVGRGETVSRSSQSMDPGAVARVNGIGYQLVSLPPTVEMQAFIPCY